MRTRPSKELMNSILILFLRGWPVVDKGAISKCKQYIKVRFSLQSKYVSHSNSAFVCMPIGAGSGRLDNEGTVCASLYHCREHYNDMP